jgi:hypothetical protein
MSWITKLQSRWKAKSIFQVILILTVFICTGTTVSYLMKPILNFFFGVEVPLWARILYFLFILPVYNIFLLCYGFLFGQFRFFWEFEKRTLRRTVDFFKGNKKSKE